MSSANQSLSVAAQALEKVLAEHLRQRVLVPFTKTGSICRSWYLKEISVSTIDDELAAIFDTYDEIVRKETSIGPAFVSWVDGFLRSANESKTIAVNSSGGVNRTWLVLALGLPHRFQTRCGPFRELAADWDAILRNTNYAPDNAAIKRESLARLHSPPKKWSPFRTLTYDTRADEPILRESLFAKLEADAREGTLALNTFRELDIQHYAGLFGCTVSAIWNYREEIEHYRSIARSVHPLDRRVPEIVAWAMRSIGEGVLPLGPGGTLGKTALVSEFDLKWSEFNTCKLLQQRRGLVLVGRPSPSLSSRAITFVTRRK